MLSEKQLADAVKTLRGFVGQAYDAWTWEQAVAAIAIAIGKGDDLRKRPDCIAYACRALRGYYRNDKKGYAVWQAQFADDAECYHAIGLVELEIVLGMKRPAPMSPEFAAAVKALTATK